LHEKQKISKNSLAKSINCAIIDLRKYPTPKENLMFFSYKKLWKLLIDREMKKKDLCAKAGISTATIAKMVKGESITTDSLLKICVALDCDVSDIMELTRIAPEK